MRAGFSGGVGREGSRGRGTLRPPELCSAAGPSLTQEGWRGPTGAH